MLELGMYREIRELNVLISKILKLIGKNIIFKSKKKTNTIYELRNYKNCKNIRIWDKR